MWPFPRLSFLASVDVVQKRWKQRRNAVAFTVLLCSIRVCNGSLDSSENCYSITMRELWKFQFFTDVIRKQTRSIRVKCNFNASSAVALVAHGAGLFSHVLNLYNRIVKTNYKAKASFNRIKSWPGFIINLSGCLAVSPSAMEDDALVKWCSLKVSAPRAPRSKSFL